jgi:hypothetical protein
MRRRAWLWVLLISVIGQAQPCPEGEAAFEKTIFPWLRSRCASCHDGSTGAPAHTLPGDVSESYARISDYVTFAQIGESRLLDMVDSKHWVKHGGKVEAESAEARKLIESWWESGQKECVSGEWSSQSVKLPELNTATFTRARIPVRPVSGLSEMTFEFDAKVLGKLDSGYVLLRNPRLASPHHAVEVSGIYLGVEGRVAEEANNWTDVKAASFPGKVPTRLSAETVILPLNFRTQTLAVRFDHLAKARATRCRFIDIFRRDVAPLYELRNCYYCHGGGPEKYVGANQAVLAFPMDVDEESLCNMSLQRMYGLEESILITYPLKGAMNHPNALVGDEAVYEKWIDWAKKEFR